MDLLFKRFDPWLIVSVLLIGVMGLFALQSSSSHSMWPLSPSTVKQIFFLAAGVGVMIFFSAVDYDAVGRLAYPIAFVNIAILIIVLVAGHSAKGAQRWIDLGGGLTIQPSEPTKIIVILALARILATVQKIDRQTIYSIVFTVLVPWFLIFIQPDLGTSLVIVFAAMVMLLFRGVNPWLLFSLVAGGGLLSPFLLKDYQKRRLTIFLNPDTDLTDSGWNIYQSKIAVGSGDVFGRGLFQGTQTQLGFVPENHTDFIFSVFGEETGFVGCMVLMLLYAFLLFRCAVIIDKSKDKFGYFTAIGIFSLIGFHVFVNLGMVMGIMPVVGIPLTFVSYGGSSFLSNMAAIGILESIYSRREMLFIT